MIVGSVAAGSSNTAASNPVLIAFTLLFIGAFAATWGPTAWVLISELYPLKLRAKAMSLATASKSVSFSPDQQQRKLTKSFTFFNLSWFWNWAIAFAVPYITDAGQGQSFLTRPSPLRPDPSFPSLLSLFSLPSFLSPSFPPLLPAGNLQTKIAFIWFATSFGAALWTYFCVPETKGLSLEELDEMFASGISYRNVRSLLPSPFNPMLTRIPQTPNWKPSGVSLHGQGAVTGLPASDEKLEKESSV